MNITLVPTTPSGVMFELFILWIYLLAAFAFFVYIQVLGQVKEFHE